MVTRDDLREPLFSVNAEIRFDNTTSRIIKINDAPNACYFYRYL